MPSGLNNAGAMHQRVMTALFHDLMNNDVEAYVDDLVAKSMAEEDHLVDLHKFLKS